MSSILFIPFGSIKHASSRLICYENAKYLQKRHWHVSVGKGDPRKFSIVVFQKRHSDKDRDIAKHCRKSIFQLSEANYLKHGWQNEILRMAKQVNAVVVSSSPIQHWFKHHGIKSTIIPTGLDFAALPKAKKRGILTICWIGSLDNERYLKMLVKPLNILWNKHNFELRVIGGRPPHLPFKGKRHFLKWELGKAERWVSECHIGIAPLRSQQYEFAKPPSKPVLYMAQGLAVVASNTPPYRDLIKHGSNGFLVTKNDVGQWTRYLEILLTDKAKRESFVAKGRVDCKKYDAPVIAKQWDAFLKSL